MQQLKNTTAHIWWTENVVERNACVRRQPNGNANVAIIQIHQKQHQSGTVAVESLY